MTPTPGSHAEKKFERDFSKFAKKVTKRIRDASRDSNKAVCNIHMHKEDHNCEKCKERARYLALKNQDKEKEKETKSVKVVNLKN